MIVFLLWFIDYSLDYGYVLVMMIYFCDVMGVGCSEMLFVCLRLWRMGRWARAILTLSHGVCNRNNIKDIMIYHLYIYNMIYIIYIIYMIYIYDTYII